MKKKISIVFIIILLPILIINLGILLNSWMHPDKVPSFFGWKPFIVLSGSMEDEFYPGDLVFVKDADTKLIRKGDVIAFKSGDVVVTHRVVDVVKQNGTAKYKTKGDNNNNEDKDYVMQQNVEGIYKFKIKKLGNLLLFIQTPMGMLVCLAIPLLLLLLIQMIENSKNKKLVYEVEEKQSKMEEELKKLKQQNAKLKAQNKEEPKKETKKNISKAKTTKTK